MKTFAEAMYSMSASKPWPSVLSALSSVATLYLPPTAVSCWPSIWKT